MIRRLVSRLLVAAFAVGFAAAAQAQNCNGQPSANTICAGPSSGGSGPPIFRAVAPGDVPLSALNYLGPGTGAVSRTLQSKLNDWISTVDYGVVTSGSDQAANVQKAINAAGNGAWVISPVSNAAILSKVTINKPLNFWCPAFSNASGGNFNGGQGTGTMFAVNASYVTFAGCYLNRAGTPQATDYGIVVGDDQQSATDAVCTSGSPTVTSAGGHFAAAIAGMRIELPNCATGPATLFASIIAVGSAGSITIDTTAGNTPGAVTAKYGNVYLENRFENLWLINHKIGLYLLEGAQQHVDRIATNSVIGMQVENQLAADYGDSFLSNSLLQSTDNVAGAGLQIISSGGLKICNDKFLFGKYGIWVNWSLGNSANPILCNNSIESFATAGIFITTAADLSRIDITGGSIAGNAGASGIVVDNASARPLANLAITGVTITGNGATALIDLGKVLGGAIVGAVLDNGSAGTCIALRSNSAAIVAPQFANYMKCATGITDVGSGNKTTINAAADISGLLAFANMGAKPAFSVTKGGTDQTGIASATFTALTWPTVVYNINGNFASNAWTPPSGKVSLFAAYNATGTITAGAQCAISIFKNGSALRQNLNSCATNDGAAHVYVEDAASGSDVYTVQAFITTSAGTATVQGAANVTYFGGHWIGP